MSPFAPYCPVVDYGDPILEERCMGELVLRVCFDFEVDIDVILSWQ